MRYLHRFILAVLVCIVFTATQADLSIYYLDVGQADAAIIQCDGTTMMIDGSNSGDSSSGGVLDTGKRRIESKTGKDRIEDTDLPFAFFTHLDSMSLEYTLPLLLNFSIYIGGL